MSAPSARWRPAQLLTRLRGRLFSAMFWNGVAGLCARGFPMLGMLLAARLLGREAFGQLGIVYGTVTMLQTFVVAGLGITATNFVARWRHSEPDRAGRIIVLSHGIALVSGGLFLVGLLASADLIAKDVLKVDGLGEELRIGGLVLIAMALNAVQTGVLMGFEAYRSMAAANIIGGVASVLLLALGARLGGVVGALFGLALAYAAQGLLNHLLIRRAMRADGVRAALRIPRDELRLLWTFSLPDLLTLALWMVPTWAASVILVRQPGGLAEMGLLAAANQWFSALILLPRMLSAVLLPVYARRLATDDAATTAPLAIKSAYLLALGMVPMIVIMIVLSPGIAALYGPSFAGHADVFVWLIVAAGLAAPQGPLTNYLVACERMWTRFAIIVLWAAVLIGGTLLLIDRGALGVAMATLIAYTSRTVLTYASVRRVASR